jgi:hypothetical protein
MDFERKFEFFKTHKNSYTGQLCITDPKYEGHDQEIMSSGQFLPQTADFRYTYFERKIEFFKNL